MVTFKFNYVSLKHVNTTILISNLPTWYTAVKNNIKLVLIKTSVKRYKTSFIADDV